MKRAQVALVLIEGHRVVAIHTGDAQLAAWFKERRKAMQERWIAIRDARALSENVALLQKEGQKLLYDAEVELVGTQLVLSNMAESGWLPATGSYVVPPVPRLDSSRPFREPTTMLFTKEIP